MCIKNHLSEGSNNHSMFYSVCNSYWLITLHRIFYFYTISTCNNAPVSAIKVQCRIAKKNLGTAFSRKILVDGAYKLVKLDKKFWKKDKSYQLNKSVLSIDVFCSGKPFRCFDAIVVR